MVNAICEPVDEEMIFHLTLAYCIQNITRNLVLLEAKGKFLLRKALMKLVPRLK